MKLVAAAALVALLAGPRPAEVSVSGDARIVGIDGAVRTTLSDLDTVVASGNASITAPGWTAALASGTRATLRTEWTAAGFIRVLDLAEGSVHLAGSWSLRHGGLLVRGRASQVGVRVQSGFLIVDVGDGDKVEIVGGDAKVTLQTGQKLSISYDKSSHKFNIVVDKDGMQPIDVKIGETTIQVTEGDRVEAVVLGSLDLFVMALAGDIKVLGPDGSLKDIAAGGSLQVAKGGEGAIKGRGRPNGNGNGNGHPPRRRGIPPAPSPTHYRDRTDVSPS